MDEARVVTGFRATLLLCLIASAPASAQLLTFTGAGADDSAGLAEAMSGLARQASAVYREPDRQRYLNAFFRLQMTAGEDEGAAASLRELGELRRATSPASAAPLLPFALLADARVRASATGRPFAEAFREKFVDEIGRLDDKAASEALYWFDFDQDRWHADLRRSLERHRGQEAIQLGDALDLVRTYHFYASFRAMMPLVRTLAAEDDGRRYFADTSVLIQTPDGAHVAALWVRPKSVKEPLPALLFMTIYADDEESFSQARTSASRGYAGVVAYSRGKGRSPETPVPYEHDGEDARAVIEWITRQPWSDGRVGMYGGSYSGFVQWAAAKKLPPALRTIVPYVAAIPGLGLPMENNVFLNANYGWAFYVTNNKYVDEATYRDPGRWESMEHNWYAGGAAYRKIDSVDGTPNPLLQRWLQHPDYDAYWQEMVPYRREYAGITIPALTITGYYDDGQISALHYVKEHYTYNPDAEHYLLIGPYDHFGAQRSRKEPVLRGYAIDSAAQFDTPEVTYQWMDYVFRGGEKPALLRDRINCQVMGANSWVHAPSLEALKGETLRLYLTDKKAGDRHALSARRPAQPGFLSQEVDFADRATTNNDYYPDLVLGKKPDLSSGYSFISEPFDQPVRVCGTFSGEIRAVINARDMDIGVVLYEVLPDGTLLHLSYFLGRASYARDMTVRKLLTPGAVESIPFERTRMVCRRLGKGSRLLVTLNVNKNPSAQLNYGTGKDVSEEDIGDAKAPLLIKWQNDSYVDIPIGK